MLDSRAYEYAKKQYTGKGTRLCREEELYQVNPCLLCGKFFMDSAVLTFVTFFFVVQSLFREEVPHFNCDANDPKGILAIDFENVTAVFTDEGRFYCIFKEASVVAAVVAAVLPAFESISLSLLLFSSSFAANVAVPLADDLYAGYTNSYNGWGSSYVLPLCLFIDTSGLNPTYWQCIRHEDDGGCRKCPPCRSTGRCFPCWFFSCDNRSKKTLWKWLFLVMILAPGVILACAIPALAYYLLMLAKTGQDFVVNLLAVQVLVTVSSDMLKRSFFPRLALRDLLRSYVDNTGTAVKAVYWPLMNATLDSRQHNMGVASKLRISLLADEHAFSGYPGPNQSALG